MISIFSQVDSNRLSDEQSAERKPNPDKINSYDYRAWDRWVLFNRWSAVIAGWYCHLVSLSLAGTLLLSPVVIIPGWFSHTVTWCHCPWLILLYCHLMSLSLPATLVLSPGVIIPGWFSCTVTWCQCSCLVLLYCHLVLCHCAWFFTRTNLQSVQLYVWCVCVDWCL